jgi:hypothetical protein
MSRRKKMISGDYNINYDKTEYEERTMELNLVIVTAEDTDKSSTEFLKELEELLKKYAI